MVTGSKSAVVHVQMPPTESSGQAQIELTVRPTKVSPDEPFLVNVFLVGTRAAEGPNQGLIGTFSFFPPPRLGEERKFLIEAPANLVALKQNFDVRIELIASTPDGKVDNSAVKVIDARVVL